MKTVKRKPGRPAGSGPGAEHTEWLRLRVTASQSRRYAAAAAAAGQSLSEWVRAALDRRAEEASKA